MQKKQEKIVDLGYNKGKDIPKELCVLITRILDFVNQVENQYEGKAKDKLKQ